MTAVRSQIINGYCSVFHQLGGNGLQDLVAPNPAPHTVFASSLNRVPCHTRQVVVGVGGVLTGKVPVRGSVPSCCSRLIVQYRWQLAHFRQGPHPISIPNQVPLTDLIWHMACAVLT